jgi:RHS repeat-associated protein
MKYFYQNNRFILALNSASSMRILSADDRPLALFNASSNTASLLGVTKTHSIQTAQGAVYTYTPFGRSSAIPSIPIAFNGERFDPFPQGYLLGNGRRLYSPGIMRFTSSDPLSPFDAGGFNAYAYCQNDPINRIDPSGLAPTVPTLKSLAKKAVFKRPTPDAEGHLRSSCDPDRLPPSTFEKEVITNSVRAAQQELLPTLEAVPAGWMLDKHRKFLQDYVPRKLDKKQQTELRAFLESTYDTYPSPPIIKAADVYRHFGEIQRANLFGQALPALRLNYPPAVSYEDYYNRQKQIRQ